MSSRPTIGETRAERPEAVRVLVRVRPPNEDEMSANFSSCISVVGRTVKISDKNQKTFTYDHVADQDTSQGDVFERVGKPITNACLSGYNGTIFAYGQTGSGKTFTIQGPGDSFGEDAEHVDMRGLCPRIFEHLCRSMRQLEQRSTNTLKYSVELSYLQIYMENIYDLLVPDSKSLSLHEDKKTGMFVEGLTKVPVQSAADCIKLLLQGSKNRRVGETAMNRESSRSHAVLTLSIKSVEDDGERRIVKRSCFNMIDLAGSERQKRTNATGDRLDEASQINKSLSTLGHVINTLSQNARKESNRKNFVHYRDSKLTHLLKDSLGGNSLTYMIACVSPDYKSLTETVSTFQFASRAKCIENKAKVNEDQSTSITFLQKENSELKEQLRRLETSLGLVSQAHAAGAQNGDAFQSPSKGSPSYEKLQMALDREKEVREENKEYFDKIAMLDELNKKLDKTVNSNKMVIEFRNKTIANLESKISKLRKDNGASIELELCGLVDLLRKEKEELEHREKFHPELLQKTLDISAMSDLIKRYEAMLSEDKDVAKDEKDRVVSWKDEKKFIQEHNFKLTYENEAMRRDQLAIQQEIDALQQKLRSPNKLLAAMPTPQRRNFESMELEKWKNEQNFTKKLKAVETEGAKVKKALEEELEKEKKTATERDHLIQDMERSLKELELKRESMVARHTSEMERLATEHAATLKREQEQSKALLVGAQNAHQEELDTMKKAYEESVSELQKGQDESLEHSNQLAMKITELRSEVEHHKQSSRLREAELESQLETEQERIQSLNDRIAELKIEHDEAAKEFSSKIAAVEGERSTLLSEKRAIEAELEKTSASLTSSIDSHADLQSKYDELEEEHTATSEKFADTQDTLTALKKDHEEALIENTTLLNENSELQREKEQLESNIALLESENEKLNDRIDAEKLTNDNLNDKLASEAEENERLSTELKKSQEVVEMSKVKINQLQATIEELRLENKDLVEENASVDVQGMTDRITELEEERQEAEAITSQMANELESRNGELKSLKKSLKKVEKEKKKLEQSEKDLSSTVNEYVTELKKAKAETQKVEAENEEVMSELKSATERNNALEKDIENLREDLSEQEAESRETEKTLRHEVTETFKELKKTQSKVDMLESEKVELNDRVISLEMSVEEMTVNHKQQVSTMEKQFTSQLKEEKKESKALMSSVRKLEKENKSLENKMNKMEKHHEEDMHSMVDERDVALAQKNRLVLEVSKLNSFLERVNNTADGDVSDCMTEEEDETEEGNTADTILSPSKAAVKKSHHEVSKLHRTQSSMRHELADAKEEVATLSASLAKKKKELTSSQRALKKVTKELEKMTSEKKELEDELDSANESLENEQMQRVSLQSLNESMSMKHEKELDEKHQEMEKMKDQLATTQTEVEGLRAECSEQELMLNDAVSKAIELERVQQELDIVRQKMTEDQQELQTARETMSSNQEHYDLMAMQMREQEKDLEALVSLQNEVKQLESEVDKLHAIKASMTEDEETLRVQLRTLQDENVGLTKERNKALKVVQDQEDKVSKLEEKLYGLAGHSNHSQKIKMHQKIKAEVDTLKSEKRVLQKKINALKKHVPKDVLASLKLDTTTFKDLDVESKVEAEENDHSKEETDEVLKQIDSLVKTFNDTRLSSLLEEAEEEEEEEEDEVEIIEPKPVRRSTRNTRSSRRTALSEVDMNSSRSRSSSKMKKSKKKPSRSRGHSRQMSTTEVIQQLEELVRHNSSALSALQ